MGKLANMLLWESFPSSKENLTLATPDVSDLKSIKLAKAFQFLPSQGKILYRQYAEKSSKPNDITHVECVHPKKPLPACRPATPASCAEKSDKTIESALSDIRPAYASQWCSIVQETPHRASFHPAIGIMNCSATVVSRKIRKVAMLLGHGWASHNYRFERSDGAGVYVQPGYIKDAFSLHIPYASYDRRR
jgi:hypothetical protein